MKKVFTVMAVLMVMVFFSATLAGAGESNKEKAKNLPTRTANKIRANALMLSERMNAQYVQGENGVKFFQKEKGALLINGSKRELKFALSNPKNSKEFTFRIKKEDSQEVFYLGIQKKL